MTRYSLIIYLEGNASTVGTAKPEEELPVDEVGVEGRQLDAAGSDGWGAGQDGWSDDWGGDAALDEVQTTRQQAAVELVAEREADIEDGWGDDTWSGFEENAAGGTMDLAANLRLSVDKEVTDEDGLSGSSPSRSPDKQRTPQHSNNFALECKVAERESEFEVLEEEHRLLRDRFILLEQEITQIQARVYKVSYSPGTGEFYQVCWRRISICE